MGWPQIVFIAWFGASIGVAMVKHGTPFPQGRWNGWLLALRWLVLAVILTLGGFFTSVHAQVPLSIEMHKVPYAQQRQLTWHAIERLPRRCGGAMDATGSGEPLAEETADKFGHGHVHQVKLNRAWYGTWMPKLVQGFEDGMIDIPADPNFAQDLRAIEEVDGIAMVAKARRSDVKDPDLFRHGDAAVMLALGWFATLNLNAQIDYIPVPSHTRGFDNKINSHADLDFPMPEPGGW